MVIKGRRKQTNTQNSTWNLPANDVATILNICYQNDRCLDQRRTPLVSGDLNRNSWIGRAKRDSELSTSIDRSPKLNLLCTGYDWWYVRCMNQTQGANSIGGLGKRGRKTTRPTTAANTDEPLTYLTSLPLVSIRRHLYTTGRKCKLHFARAQFVLH